MQTLARKSSENREDSVDVVIEKRRTARRMAPRSTVGEIDDMAM